MTRWSLCGARMTEMMFYLQAKQGRKIPEKKCDDPISEHFRLGLEIELKGTPAVFSEEGVELGGFIKAKDVERMLFKDKP